MPLYSEARREIDALVARFEASTHIEAVAAVVHKADGHPDIPWKAYALGTALAAWNASGYAAFTFGVIGLFTNLCVPTPDMG